MGTADVLADFVNPKYGITTGATVAVGSTQCSFYDGFRYNVSMPSLASYTVIANTDLYSPATSYYTNSQTALQNPTQTWHQPPMFATLVNDDGAGHSWTPGDAGAVSTIAHIGVSGLTHYLYDLHIDGHFYTRYIKPRTPAEAGPPAVPLGTQDEVPPDFGQGAAGLIDPAIEQNMNLWTIGNGVRLILVQQHKKEWNEPDIKESDMFDRIFSKEAFYDPTRSEMLRKHTSVPSVAELQNSSIGASRTRTVDFHIIWRKDIYHGSVNTTVQDLTQWTTRVKKRFKFEGTSFAKAKWFVNPNDPKLKTLMNPVFLFVLPLLPEKPGGGRFTVDDLRPHMYFKGDIRVRQWDESTSSAFVH